MNRYIIGGLLLIAATVIVIGVVAKNNQKSREPIVFSQNTMLSNLWFRYKQDYLEPGTNRTLDKQRNNITTSEGQSYTMLRAVWQDDKETFDKSWKWTKDNLARPNDRLPAWLFGERADGSYGILSDEGGQNTATDGDTDIALALIFASQRWNDSIYLEEAKGLIDDIWTNDVIQIKGQPYIVAGSSETESNSETAVINPSYLSPYTYKIFSKVDSSHNWEALVDSSYSIIELSSAAKLDKSNSSGLPPDWILINRETGAITPATKVNLSSNYGYDAMRTPWRLALDWEWNKDERAKKALESFSFLGKQWSTKSKISTVYSHDGQVIEDYESPAVYAGNIGYFLVIEPSVSEEIYKAKLGSLYSPDTQSWIEPLGYYEDNWAWFGIALLNKQLPNLAENIKVILK